MNNTNETIQDLINRIRTCQLSIHFQYQNMQNGFEQFVIDSEAGNV